MAVVGASPHTETEIVEEEFIWGRRNVDPSHTPDLSYRRWILACWCLKRVLNQFWQQFTSLTL